MQLFEALHLGDGAAEQALVLAAPGAAGGPGGGLGQGVAGGQLVAVGHARPRPRHPREEVAGVGGVAEAAGRLALLGGGEVGGAEVVPGLQAGVTHQPRGGGAGELRPDGSHAHPGNQCQKYDTSRHVTMT